MMKEMVYWSVDLGEPEAELEAIKENRLRYAVAAIHSVLLRSHQSSYGLLWRFQILHKNQLNLR
jgi:hypothetical protein